MWAVSGLVCAFFFPRVALAALFIQVSTTVAGHKTQRPHLPRVAVSHSCLRSCLISYEGEAETPTVFSLRSSVTGNPLN